MKLFGSNGNSNLTLASITRANDALIQIIHASVRRALDIYSVTSIANYTKFSSIYIFTVVLHFIVKIVLLINVKCKLLY